MLTKCKHFETNTTNFNIKQRRVHPSVTLHEELLDESFVNMFVSSSLLSIFWKKGMFTFCKMESVFLLNFQKLWSQAHIPSFTGGRGNKHIMWRKKLAFETCFFVLDLVGKDQGARSKISWPNIFPDGCFGNHLGRWNRLTAQLIRKFFSNFENALRKMCSQRRFELDRTSTFVKLKWMRKNFTLLVRYLKYFFVSNPRIMQKQVHKAIFFLQLSREYSDS